MTGRKPRPAMCSLLAVLTAVGLFGCDWFDPPQELQVENLTDNGGESSYPRLASGPDGVVGVAWRDNFEGDEDIYIRECRINGDWTPATNATALPGGSRFADICYDSLGQLHLVWQQFTGTGWTIMYRLRDTDGDWCAPETIGGDMAALPRLRGGAKPVPEFVYIEGFGADARLRYAAKQPDSSWAVSTVPTRRGPLYAEACELPGDSLLVVWIAGYGDTVFWSLHTPAAGWLADQPLGVGVSYRWPALRSDGRTAYALYDIQGDPTRLMLRRYSGAWSKPEALRDVRYPCSFVATSLPNSGRVLAAIVDSDGSVSIREDRCRWRSLGRVDPGGSRRDFLGLVATTQDEVCAVWQERGRDERDDVFAVRWDY